MKLVFSRKGFDGGYGGVPSPILPDGSMLSLPIPHADPIRTFGNIVFNNRPVSEIVSELTRNRLQAADSCHLDPDLRRETVKRPAGWRPVFGQVGAAQGHLQNHEIGKGDLFLFFGWFRQTEYRDGRLVYRKRAPDIHLIYGWLQVAAVWRPTLALIARYPWLKNHPHCQDSGWHDNNSLYVASPSLAIGRRIYKLPGGGVFPAYNNELQLTAPDSSRSVWRLPGWMHPAGRRSTLTYHGERRIWQRHGEDIILKSRAKGQEFILDTDDYPEALDWLDTLFLRVPNN